MWTKQVKPPPCDASTPYGCQLKSWLLTSNPAPWTAAGLALFIHIGNQDEAPSVGLAQSVSLWPFEDKLMKDSLCTSVFQINKIHHYEENMIGSLLYSNFLKALK